MPGRIRSLVVTEYEERWRVSKDDGHLLRVNWFTDGGLAASYSLLLTFYFRDKVNQIAGQL